MNGADYWKYDHEKCRNCDSFRGCDFCEPEFDHLPYPGHDSLEYEEDEECAITSPYNYLF